ncbi:MAG: zinc ribbon domain-containing protein [Gemmataceae bacterium]
MTTPAAILRELHRLRRYLKDLQTEIDRGPRMQKALQAKVARQEEFLRQAHDTIKRLKAQGLEKESAFKSAIQQIAKYEKQRESASTQKELTAFDHEIAAAKEKSQQLEDEILRNMTEIEERTAQIPELEKNVETAKTEWKDFEQNYQSRVAGLRTALAETQQQLADVEKTLPEDVLSQYKRLVAAKGEDALSPVRNRGCLACYTTITAQNIHDLTQGMFVLCKSCGRILYLPEE